MKFIRSFGEFPQFFGEKTDKLLNWLENKMIKNLKKLSRIIWNCQFTLKATGLVESNIQVRSTPNLTNFE
jgi:hypothetical protein